MDTTKSYYPQLDALRAIAVLLVIVSHWFNHDHLFNRYTFNGIWGVTLFFVLSGFLITRILLKSKLALQTHSVSLLNVFKVFYIRRTLRIFPLYYLMLLIVLVFTIVPLKDSFIWHLLYGSNLYFWINGHFQGQLSHLWSLAVEEQFYLFWPACILLIPLNNQPLIYTVGIIVAILFRCYFYYESDDFGRLLMPGSLDSFCIGALLAYGLLNNTKLFCWYQSKAVGVFVATLIVHVLAWGVFKLDKSKFIFSSIYFTSVSIFSVQIIYFSIAGIKNRLLASLFNNKWLQYLGKISYGLYVYHNLLPYIYDIHFPIFLSSVSLYLAQLIRFALLIVIASLSWFLFEKPILSFKRNYSV